MTAIEPTEACPFCGYSNCSVSDGNNGLHFRVICGRGACRAAGPLERCAADAVSAWNSRVSSAPQEPDDAEWLLSHAKYVKSLIGAGKGTLFFDADIEKLERIATRLQAKAPETGEG